MALRYFLELSARSWAVVRLLGVNEIANHLTVAGMAMMLIGGGLFVFVNRDRSIEIESSDAPPPRRTTGRHGVHPIP